MTAVTAAGLPAPAGPIGAAAPIGPRPVRDTWTLARRNLRHAFQPGRVVLTPVSPLIFLGGFYLLFNRLYAAEGVSYGQYLTPAIATICALFIGQDAGNQLAADRRTGLLDRYRSLPIWPGAALAARLVADAARVLWAVLATVLVGHLTGFRFDGGPLAAAAFVGVAVAFGLALVSLGAALGVAPPRVHALQPIIFLPLLLLFQFSTALVPVSDFPGWLRPIASGSPFSSTIDALRALAADGPAGGAVWPALAWSGGLLLAFGYLGARVLGRPR